MSEHEVQEQSPVEVPMPAKPVTAGSLLRAAREASGLHIAALSVSMKVPEKKLEALESDRTDLLPDAVFVRALASSVCRTLKIDSAPILELLPQNLVPSLDAGHKGINAPFKVPGEVRHTSWSEFLRRPPVIAVIGLLFAAVLVVFMPEITWPESTSSKEVVTPASVAVKEAPAETQQLESAQEKVVSAEIVPSSPSVEAAKPLQSAASAAVAAVSAPAVKPGEMVVIRAKGTTWVEVIDATGAVLVRRTLQADGMTSATGVAPLAVVVGKADVADVEVRGKPFSLTGVSKDNVARFEVK